MMHIITLFYVFCICICIVHMQMDALPSTITYERLMKQLEQDYKQEIQDKPTEQAMAQEKEQRNCTSAFSRIWYALQGYTPVNSGKQD